MIVGRGPANQRPGLWEACSAPERPPDKDCDFVVTCPACLLKLKLTISAPAPEGHFNGWYERRNEMVVMLAERGIDLDFIGSTRQW